MNDMTQAEQLLRYNNLIGVPTNICIRDNTTIVTYENSVGEFECRFNSVTRQRLQEDIY